MHIPKYLLEAWLGLNNAESDNTFIDTCRTEGPGEWDQWLDMEEQEACWHNRDSSATVIRNKKIIFSNTLRSIQVLMLEEYYAEYFLNSALIQYTEVYLWPDERTLLTECKPILSVDEFIAKKHLIHPATEHQVKKSLVNQGAMTDDFVILDAAAYKKLREKYKAYCNDVRNIQQKTHPAENQAISLSQRICLC